MTSNIGASEISKDAPLGFAQTKQRGLSYEDMKSRITGELKRVFRPEFLNRVDEVIVFHKLERDEISQIVDLMIARLGDQLAAQGVRIALTEAGRELLVEKGYDPVLGARPLRRAIQRLHRGPARGPVPPREDPSGGGGPDHEARRRARRRGAHRGLPGAAGVAPGSGRPKRRLRRRREWPWPARPAGGRGAA